ncbi:prenyltransferase/squalene oxidase repeat-containing protein [Desulfoscipio sp. XC116]|uniref:prenyltransferase/squalene oxidase repeat-containing protein n=1 Tax=Desulfoscipio sp. XC116 TaxID=3144975 RepID=UPI00325A5733
MFNQFRKTLAVVGVLVFMLALAPVAWASVTPGSPEVREAVKGAVSYLDKELQAPGYDGMLEWAMLGYYGIGKDAGHLSKLRETQLAQGVMLSEAKSTDYQRTVLGAAAAGKSPDGYGGKNLLQSIISSQTLSGKFADTINGTGEKLVNAHIWGIISLYVAGQDIPRADLALRWLTAHQNADGGFSVDIRLDESDVDMTAMAIIAMACLDKDSGFLPVQKALAYLKEQQNEDGTFGAWGTSTAESCAQVVQALTILGIDPTADEWSKDGGNAVTGLLQYRLADGSFSHGSERLPNDMASAQALIALGDYQTGQSVYQKIRANMESK